MNVCMVGYGMMGTWHSESLKNHDCVLHTLVGHNAEIVLILVFRLVIGEQVRPSKRSTISKEEIDSVSMATLRRVVLEAA